MSRHWRRNRRRRREAARRLQDPVSRATQAAVQMGLRAGLEALRQVHVLPHIVGRYNTITMGTPRDSGSWVRKGKEVEMANPGWAHKAARNLWSRGFLDKLNVMIIENGIGPVVDAIREASEHAVPATGVDVGWKDRARKLEEENHERAREYRELVSAMTVELSALDARSVTSDLARLGNPAAAFSRNVKRYLDELRRLRGHVCAASKEGSSWGEKYHALLEVVRGAGEKLNGAVMCSSLLGIRETAEQVLVRSAEMCVDELRILRGHQKRAEIMEEGRFLNEVCEAAGLGMRGGGREWVLEQVRRIKTDGGRAIEQSGNLSAANARQAQAIRSCDKALLDALKRVEELGATNRRQEETVIAQSKTVANLHLEIKAERMRLGNSEHSIRCMLRALGIEGQDQEAHGAIVRAERMRQELQETKEQLALSLDVNKSLNALRKQDEETVSDIQSGARQLKREQESAMAERNKLQHECDQQHATISGLRSDVANAVRVHLRDISKADKLEYDNAALKAQLDNLKIGAGGHYGPPIADAHAALMTSIQDCVSLPGQAWTPEPGGAAGQTLAKILACEHPYDRRLTSPMRRMYCGECGCDFRLWVRQ